jgi:hypothetical protein
VVGRILAAFLLPAVGSQLDLMVLIGGAEVPAIQIRFILPSTTERKVSANSQFRYVAYYVRYLVKTICATHSQKLLFLYLVKCSAHRKLFQIKVLDLNGIYTLCYSAYDLSFM